MTPGDLPWSGLSGRTRPAPAEEANSVHMVADGMWVPGDDTRNPGQARPWRLLDNEMATC
jgi:hypothetical protein